jgi:predicted MFS family arabinose efflux permease
MVAGVAIVAVGLIPMLFLREREGAERRPVREAYGKSFVGFKSWRHVGKLIAPQAIISLGGGLVMPFIPLYLKGSLHASLGQIGLILGLSSIVTAFGAFGTPVIARKFGLGTGVSMLQGLAVPFLAIVSLAHSLPLAVGALWVRGTLMNMAGPLFNQLSMEGLDEHEKPTVGGWLFCALNLTWLVGSLVGGKLMETSYVAPYIGAVVLYATGAGLTYLLWGGKGKAAEEPEGSLEALPEAA